MSDPPSHCCCDLLVPSWGAARGHPSGAGALHSEHPAAGCPVSALTPIQTAQPARWETARLPVCCRAGLRQAPANCPARQPQPRCKGKGPQDGRTLQEQRGYLQRVRPATPSCPWAAREEEDGPGRAGVSWHLLSTATQAFPRGAMQQTPWQNSHPPLQTRAPEQQKREGKGSLLQLSTAGAFLGTEQQSTAEKARQNRASAQGERGEGSQGSGQGRAAHPHCAPALCTRIPPAAQGPAQRQRFVCQAVRWKPSRSSV